MSIRWCYADGCFDRSDCAIEVEGRDNVYYCALHASDLIRIASRSGCIITISVERPKRKER